jgi:hypothetical protein
MIDRVVGAVGYEAVVDFLDFEHYNIAQNSKPQRFRLRNTLFNSFS